MKTVLLAAAIVSQSAFAFVPAPGLWNTSSIDGQGFNIETQDNIMIVTAYVFDTTGKQIWYLAAGVYDERAATFTATLANATNGSCLSCAYKAPSKNGNAGGNFKIIFSSREKATVYFDGGSRSIEHYNYGYADRTSYFNGEWQFSYQGFAGIVDGQWVKFPGTTFKDSGGVVYASGVEDQYSNSVALGRYDASSGTYLVGVADGYGTTYLYQFTGDNQHMLGLGYLNSYSGTAHIAQGSRIFTPHELTDPGSAISNPNSLTSRYAALAAAMAGEPIEN